MRLKNNRFWLSWLTEEDEIAKTNLYISSKMFANNALVRQNN